MKAIKLLWVCLSVAGVAMGAVLDVWTDTLNNTPFTTARSGKENVLFTSSDLSVTTTAGKDFLVLSSFTTGNNSKNNSRKGRWQIATDYSGGDYSYSDSASMGGSAIYERWINGRENAGANEYGSVNMSGIYNFGSSGTHSFDLHHRTDLGADLNTQNGTMVVVGLNVAGTTLRHGTVRQDTDITSAGPTPFMSETTSDSWSTVKQSSGGSDLATTIDVSEHGGEIFVAASMNCNKSGTGTDAVAGEWQLVLYDSEGAEVERLGTTIKRDVTDSSKDDGAAMLYATTSDLPPGTYTVKMEQKVDAASATAGRGVETFNASINAVALTLQDGDEAGQNFESFSVGNTATESNDSVDYLKAVEQESFTLAEDQGFILAANFTTTGSGGAQTGDLAISLYNEDGSTSIYDSVETLRTVGASGGMGAGGVIGYDELTAGTYDAALNFRSDANTFSITDANLVGFSTQSVPEPTTVSLFALTAAAAVFFRRHFCS